LGEERELARRGGWIGRSSGSGRCAGDVGCGIASGKVLDDGGDEPRVGDVCENSKGRPTARAAADIDTEGAPHESRDGRGRAKQDARAESLHPAKAGARTRT